MDVAVGKPLSYFYMNKSLAIVGDLKPQTAYTFRLKNELRSKVVYSPAMQATTGALAPSGTGTGLLLDRYYAFPFMSGRFVPRVQTSLDFRGGDLIPEDKLPEEFEASLTGQIQARAIETYTFEVESAGQRLWVGNQLVIDAWDENSKARSGSILLSDRKTPIKWQLRTPRHRNPQENVLLRWKSGNFPLQVVPTSQLFPDAQPQNMALLRNSSQRTTLKRGEVLELTLEMQVQGSVAWEEGDKWIASQNHLFGIESVLGGLRVDFSGSALMGRDYLVSANPPIIFKAGRTLLTALDDGANAPSRPVILSLRPSPTFNTPGEPIQVDIVNAPPKSF